MHDLHACQDTRDCMTRNPIEKIIIIIIKPLFTALFARSYGDYNITPDMLLIVFHSKLQHLKFYDFTCFPTRGYFFYNNYCYPCFFTRSKLDTADRIHGNQSKNGLKRILSKCKFWRYLRFKHNKP